MIAHQQCRQAVAAADVGYPDARLEPLDETGHRREPRRTKLVNVSGPEEPLNLGSRRGGPVGPVDAAVAAKSLLQALEHEVLRSDQIGSGNQEGR